jgi:hypothetical protein
MAFVLSVGLWFIAPNRPNAPSDSGNHPPIGAIPSASLNFDVLKLIPLITGIVSAIGTLSTVILASRTDKRSAKESELRLLQMQRQIAEMQAKIIVESSGSPSSAKSA